VRKEVKWRVRSFWKLEKGERKFLSAAADLLIRDARNASVPRNKPAESFDAATTPRFNGILCLSFSGDKWERTLRCAALLRVLRRLQIIFPPSSLVLKRR